jgi:hypothetical protein
MKFSAQAAMVMAVVFAIICLSYATRGFSSLGEITDPQQLVDAKGFAWFWVFLGGVSIAFGLLTWWAARTQVKGEDSR